MDEASYNSLHSTSLFVYFLVCHLYLFLHFPYCGKICLSTYSKIFWVGVMENDLLRYTSWKTTLAQEIQLGSPDSVSSWEGTRSVASSRVLRREPGDKATRSVWSVIVGVNCTLSAKSLVHNNICKLGIFYEQSDWCNNMPIHLIIRPQFPSESAYFSVKPCVKNLVWRWD